MSQESHTCSCWRRGGGGGGGGAQHSTAVVLLQGHGICAKGPTGKQGGRYIRRDGATVRGTASPGIAQ